MRRLKKCLTSGIAVLMSLCLLIELFPGVLAASDSSGTQVLTLDNGSIRADVSISDGGFSITTENGDRLNKSDNNKKLLFHDGQYDTSFSSFEVTDGSGTKDYIFGGNYSFLGLASSPVTVSKNNDNSEIDAAWSPDGVLLITQKISLASDSSQLNGMVDISYSVENRSNASVSVKARVLMDTALGDQDYGCYEVLNSRSQYQAVTTEQIITPSSGVPMNFYAYDDPNSPSVSAYTVSTQGGTPYQVAFAHWNDLASTAFGFTPDSALNFTDPHNKYLTADSAYAMYYDMNTVNAGQSSQFSTYYGVYSHNSVTSADSMAVDVTSPTTLQLDSAKDAYVPQNGMKGAADFLAQAQIQNFTSSTAKAYANVTLAVRCDSNIRPLDGTGNVTSVDYGSTDPYTLNYSSVKVGDTESTTLYFQAKVNEDAMFSKIRLEVYDTSQNQGLTANNLLGSKDFYILCPGSGEAVPKITFTAMNPSIIYDSGTRHLYVTGTNINYLFSSIRSGNCSLNAVSKSGQSVTVTSANILQPNANTLDVILTDAMATGSWHLQFDWTDTANTNGMVTADEQHMTAPALSFTVSDDEKYKSETYGVVAVVKIGSDSNPSYRIKSFPDESSYDTYRDHGVPDPARAGQYVKDYTEILLEFRGEFTVKSSIGDPDVSGMQIPSVLVATSKKTLDSNGKANVTNLVTLNNCVDFENGTITLSYDISGGVINGVNTKFDGDLYTSGARTSIWKGQAALTDLADGTDFALLPYDTSGTRASNIKSSTINLLWPSVYGDAQSIAGMVFNLAYGVLGVVNNDDGTEKGRVISFTAKLDLGFLIPGQSNGNTENTYWTRLKDFWSSYREGGMHDVAWYVANGDTSDLFSSEETGKDSGEGSVMVNDILYGCGAGFYGVHFSANISLPSYVAGMPKLQGTLDVNTIGNWSMEVSGSMKMATFTMQADLALKSYKNIPVPDKISFFVGGFEPGVNIDTFGVIWITGGGGGISNIYDTIFLHNSVPPLKLLLSVSFDILKVLSARADFSVGLTGISFNASDVEIKGTNLVVLNKAGAEFDWYPDFYLMGTIQMSLFGFVNGSGYMVLTAPDYTNWFFEAFVRATIQIPDSIPIVGGFQIGGVDLGVSSEKIWGALKVLGITTGLTYYWKDKSVDFGSGVSAQPTYPDLLQGYEDIPVYYDAANNRTLYIHAGTNLSMAAKAQVTDSIVSLPSLMGAARIYSDITKTTHEFNLGPYSGESAVVNLAFDVTDQNSDGKIDKTDAQAIAQNIINNGVNKVSYSKDSNGDVSFPSTAGSYPITLYNGLSGSNSNAAEANANVTFDSSKNKGSLAITATSSSCFDQWWQIKTPVSADITLLNVGAVPEINSVSGSVSGNSISLSWNGSDLADLDDMKLYLVADPNNTGDAGYALTDLTTGTAITTDDINGSASVAIPANIPSGNYYVRAVYSQNGVVNSAVVSSGTVSVLNTNTPGAVSIGQVSSGGDLTFNIPVTDTNADGYLVNIYDNVNGTWQYSDINNMTFDNADITGGVIHVGGSMQVPDPNDSTKTVTTGLAAGKPYKISVTPYKYIDKNSDGKPDTAVYGTETFCGGSDVNSAAAEALPAPTPTTVTVTADQPSVKTGTTDTFNSPGINLTAHLSQNCTGTWSLDGGTSDKGLNSSSTVSGSFAEAASVIIPLCGLAEGNHTLTVKGVNSSGDGFRYDYSFSVDTLPPKLLLSAPTDGSFFNENGTLTVTGFTDADALFTVVSDGTQICGKKSAASLGSTLNSDGSFSFTVTLPDAGSASSHDIQITASDATGNSVTRSATVHHSGLGDIKSLSVYANGSVSSDGNIPVNPLTETTKQLTLVATTDSGASFVLNDPSLVDWNCFAAEGTASLSDGGILTMGAGSAGYVKASLKVSSAASLNALATFGQERNEGKNSVISNASLGGSVNGAGQFSPGESVTLTAVPDSGYSFSGWALTGVTVPNLSSPTITFVMPDNSVLANASFTSTSGYEKPVSSISPVHASAGKKESVKMPSGVNGNTLVPYCYVNGEKKYAAISFAADGALDFIAPVEGTYYFEENNVSFNDVSDHWAKDYIDSAASHGLINGVGSGQFDPNGSLDRAMFVTILWRLAGMPQASGDDFKDIAAGDWYSQAVKWAHGNNIVDGIGNGLFDPNGSITREQMCTMLLRYLDYRGTNLSGPASSQVFSDQSSISSWASDAINKLQSMGIISGESDGSFDPQNSATRAEGCAVFCRLVEAILKAG